MIERIKPKISDPWKLFSEMSKQCKNGFYFDNWGYEGFTYFGFDPVEVIQGKANQDDVKVYNKIEQMLNQRKGKNNFPFESGVVGLVGYNLCAEFEEYPRKKVYETKTPDYHFGRYNSVFIYDHHEKKYYVSRRENASDTLIKAVTNVELNTSETSDWSAESFVQPTGKKGYESFVERTVEYIKAGDVFQANLAHPIRFDFKGAPRDLFGTIRGHNPSPYNSYYYTPDFTVVSNSPELLYSVKGRYVKTKPIAGTRPRGSNADDEAGFKKELFVSEKEKAEHLMLVDLERNDLGRFCEIGTVEVEKFMDCELYKDVMHIVSTVTGTAKKEISAPAMLQHLFPGGTITGAPKIRSIEIIDELENADRKFYTGSLGYFDDNGDCETNILIRTLLIEKNDEKQVGEMHFGAGIVADSIPEKEFEETMHKAASWMKMLTKERKN